MIPCMYCVPVRGATSLCNLFIASPSHVSQYIAAASTRLVKSNQQGQRENETRAVLWCSTMLPSASRNLLIISKRYPENSPEYSSFFYLYGNHDATSHCSRLLLWRCYNRQGLKDQARKQKEGRTRMQHKNAMSTPNQDEQVICLRPLAVFELCAVVRRGKPLPYGTRAISVRI